MNHQPARKFHVHKYNVFGYILPLWSITIGRKCKVLMRGKQSLNHVSIIEKYYFLHNCKAHLVHIVTVMLQVWIISGIKTDNWHEMHAQSIKNQHSGESPLNSCRHDNGRPERKHARRGRRRRAVISAGRLSGSPSPSITGPSPLWGQWKNLFKQTLLQFLSLSEKWMDGLKWLNSLH